MEISKGDRYNPIKQDISNGRPRQVAEIPPFQGYPCNYGALPETWEDPNAIDAHTGIGGDDDPLDVCEIGSAFATCGQVKKIKPLGAFVILAEGETDWKIVAVGVGDPLANELSEICDVQRCFPGFVDSLKVWYRRYKVPEGKDEDMLGLHGELMSREPSVCIGTNQPFSYCMEASEWIPRCIVLVSGNFPMEWELVYVRDLSVLLNLKA